MSAASLEEKARILLVDDDDGLLKLGREQLEQMGFKVITCHNGQEAVEKALRFKPDIALVDVIMPGMNGWQVCKTLKSDPETSSIPIFYVTCLGDEEDIHRHWRSGADGYFIKPFDFESVAKRLVEVIEKQRRARSSNPQQAHARTP